MTIRFLVNFGLLAIPIGTTLGVLFGIQSHRQATGQAPLFVDNGVSTDTYCQKSYGISPPAKGLEYTLNPNQWGWTEGTPGSLCMNVTTFHNKTYPTSTTAPPFSVTWKYPPGPEDAPVHAFPNIRVDSPLLPVSLDSLQSINVDIAWSYAVGNRSASSTDVAKLTDSSLNANVAIDMFMDSDKTKAGDSAKAGYEVMVWLADFGAATQPIGLAQGAVATEIVNGTTFSLYGGQNSANQLYVLTWVAQDPVEKLNTDISPLIKRILATSNDKFPKSSDYLGYIGLGSETLWAQDFVTFDVPKLAVDIHTSASA
ncbi:hypothetical protein VTK73DRAFT_6692 [Phialemonium thermophilum]|uniref:Uncharacterized protein n=1 Tax=Phialemonium thermophilum TaxID=223376 RepID=A0ABR3WIN6_9PEZI